MEKKNLKSHQVPCKWHPGPGGCFTQGLKWRVDSVRAPEATESERAGAEGGQKLGEPRKA